MCCICFDQGEEPTIEKVRDKSVSTHHTHTHTIADRIFQFSFKMLEFISFPAKTNNVTFILDMTQHWTVTSYHTVSFFPQHVTSSAVFGPVCAQSQLQILYIKSGQKATLPWLKPGPSTLHMWILRSKLCYFSDQLLSASEALLALLCQFKIKKDVISIHFTIK